MVSGRLDIHSPSDLPAWEVGLDFNKAIGHATKRMIMQVTGIEYIGSTSYAQPGLSRESVFSGQGEELSSGVTHDLVLYGFGREEEFAGLDTGASMGLSMAPSDKFLKAISGEHGEIMHSYVLLLRPEGQSPSTLALYPRDHHPFNIENAG